MITLLAYDFLYLLLNTSQVLYVLIPFVTFLAFFLFPQAWPCAKQAGFVVLPTGFLALSAILQLLSGAFTGCCLPTITIYDFFPFMEQLVWVRWAFVFDPTVLLMCTTVLWVSFAVQLFARYYMAGDPFIVKFLNLLVLFTGCMLLFVSAENLFVMFCGWEALGVCSFALIGFWDTRLQAVKAALKAITANRFGDCAFLMAIVLTWFEFHTLSFSDLALLAEAYSASSVVVLNLLTYPISLCVLDILALSFLLAAFAKSAQIGFHVWLSDAMEGPTPVSALLHAATMVTAGLFLLIRVAPVMQLCFWAQTICLLVGALTALLSAIFAFFQYDLKKMIAFSTSSQVGFMFVACGAGCPNIAFYHLMTHAFFKALLFVCAGCVIHTFDGEQDVRKMGGLFFNQPLVFGAMLIGSMALVGIPFFAGFYSKDLIFGLLASSGSQLHVGAFFVIVLAACLTSAYTANMLNLIFFGYRRSSLNQILRGSAAGRVDVFGFAALGLLALPSVIAGWAIRQIYPWMWVSSEVFAHSDFLLLQIEAVELLPSSYKVVVLVPPFVFCAWFLVQRFGPNYLFSIKSLFLREVFLFFQNRAFFENIYYYFLVRPCLTFIYFTLLVQVERFTLEFLTVELPVSATLHLSGAVSRQHVTSLISHIGTFVVVFFLTAVAFTILAA